ncbi:MAG: tetratricopeptide repeat protein [Chitinivibrionales bacterium]
MRQRSAIGVALLLAITTAVVYSGVFSSEFVNYDDDVYVTTNIHLRQGLSWEGVRWAFTTVYASNWHPLTWLSHMLDVQLFGLNPAGHHFTSLLFHVLATLLLFGFLRYATGKIWLSAFVAALFALHPMHVESVAWVAERKDVLSAVFWFAALWAYAFYTRRPGIGRYGTVAVLFALGLMAKPMLVTLPLVLLLLDYWPLERLEMNRRCFVRLVAEKLPLFVLSIASATITIISQREAIAGFNRFNIMTRVSNAVVSYCIYIRQAIWPEELAVFYPYPQHLFPVKTVACALLLIAITAAVVRIGSRRKKYLVMGWFWFLLTLAPVIGIMQIGSQAHADRYTYIPFIGIFIIISWGLETIVDRLETNKKLIAKIVVVALILAMIGITREQVGYWKNGFTLFSHAIAVTKNNYVAYNNLGTFLNRTGQTSDAMAYYQKALSINPAYGDAHYNLAIILRHLGRMDEAIAHYRKALEINPNRLETINNLAVAYLLNNQVTDAMPLLQKALSLAKTAGDEAKIRELTESLEALK